MSGKPSALPDVVRPNLAIYLLCAVGSFGARRIKRSICPGGDQAQMAQRLADIPCLLATPENLSYHTGWDLGTQGYQL